MNQYIDTLTREQKLAVIKECNRLSKGSNPKFPNSGLCSNIMLTTDVSGSALVANLATSWKHYNGNPTHPINGNHIAYKESKENNTLWLGEQGKLRRSLARHIAKKLKETL